MLFRVTSSRTSLQVTVQTNCGGKGGRKVFERVSFRAWHILQKVSRSKTNGTVVYLKLFGSYSRHTLWIFGIGRCWPEYPRFPFKNVHADRPGPGRPLLQWWVWCSGLTGRWGLGWFWPENAGKDYYWKVARWGGRGTESEAVYRERVTSSFGNTISKFGSSRSARSQIRTQNLALRGADRCAAVALGVFGERAPRIIVYLIVVVGAKVSVRIICTRCVCLAKSVV